MFRFQIFNLNPKYAICNHNSAILLFRFANLCHKAKTHIENQRGQYAGMAVIFFTLKGSICRNDG